MKKVENHILAQLLMETRFAPAKKQLAQLDAAENLYHQITPDTDYPFEFICFQITGYRPKEFPPDWTISFDQLKKDLPAFIARKSAALKLKADQQNQPVYTIQALAEKLNVSTKTIRRWRSKGLIARTFIFPKHRTALGFTEEAVRRFSEQNPDLVAAASKFSQLSETEKKQLVHLAKDLFADKSLSNKAVINRIAHQLGRAPETIRYTLKNSQTHLPAQTPIGSTASKDAAAIYNMYRSKTPIEQIMKKFDKARSTIYRIINQKRARLILAEKLDYIPAEQFFAENAETDIRDSEPEIIRIFQRRPHPPIAPAKDAINRYFELINSTPVLTRQQETELFKRYNFCKFLALKEKTAISLTSPNSKNLRRAERFIAEAARLKNILIEANLRTVAAIASKHSSAHNLGDLISEGNLALMDAVEKFDYTRGVRFATFGSWIIAKDFAKKSPYKQKTLTTTAGFDLSYLPSAQPAGSTVEIVEKAYRSLNEVIENELDEREQYIIRYHFGLIGSTVKKDARSLKQIGDELGISKERVRQIELIALQKLRKSLSPQQFEMLIG